MFTSDVINSIKHIPVSYKRICFCEYAISNRVCTLMFNLLGTDDKSGIILLIIDTSEKYISHKMRYTQF